MSSPPIPERLGLILGCRGLGDCLFAMAVMRKMHASLQGRCAFDLFTHQPELFRACPWVSSARAINDEAAIRAYPHGKRVMFELDKLPHWAMDTFDFVSVPLGMGTLSYREKRLQYFPVEADGAQGAEQFAGPAEGRAPELWKTTCFEAFLRAKGEEAYREWNFAPTGNWAAYDFKRYRKGRTPPKMTESTASFPSSSTRT